MKLQKIWQKNKLLKPKYSPFLSCIWLKLRKVSEQIDHSERLFSLIPHASASGSPEHILLCEPGLGPHIPSSSLEPGSGGYKANF